MSQAHSIDDAEFASIKPAAAVPMLDWPSDLFSDDASLTDLVTVDFLLQCDPSFLPHIHQGRDQCIQLAA
jgi:hypothetical protein